MNILKKILSLFLTIVLLMNFMVIGDYNTYAEIVDSESINNEEDTFEWENPLYKGLDIKKYSQNTQRDSSRSKVVYSLKEAAEKMRIGMVSRNSNISFTLKNIAYYPNIAKDIFALAIEDNADANSSEGDYLYLNSSGYSGQIMRYSDGRIEFYFNVSYLSNYAQERAVDEEVKRVLSSLNIEEKDDYTKAKLIHDYIVKNIKYDYSLNNHSAYNAIINKSVVCQGFASLTYKMFKEAGLNVRAICGIGNGGPHAWNIVKLGSKFYNVDNTWDACYSESGGIRYDWFLKHNNNFPKHYRDSEYNTYSFNQKYPMATESYKYNSVTTISLNTNDLKMNIGDTEKIKASLYPSNATNKSITYESGNKNIVKVDKNGKITAVGEGEAYVYIRANGGDKEEKCKITVKKPIYVSGISLNKKTISLAKGKTSTLVATVSPSNATNKKVTWKSSDIKVVKVDSDGKVTAVGAGSAAVTATTINGNKIASCKVNVYVPAHSITLNKTTLNLNKGKTSTLVATVSPSNTTNKNVTWKSSNTKVAKVDSRGKITAIGVGSATITAITEDGNKKATCKVNVSVYVNSVKLNKSTLSLLKGKSETLKATINPSNATNKNVTWKSSNTKVAKVDSKGKVTAVGSGSATITVTTIEGKKTSSCKVTVKTPVLVSSIKLNKRSIKVIKGYSTDLKATINPSNATNKNVTWKSSNTKVAKVDSKGKVTAVGAGSATITVTTIDGKKRATCKVTVSNPILVKSVTLNRTSLTLIKGKSETLKATINPSDATNKNVKWKSSNTNVVKVDSYGNVTAAESGSATITVTTADGKKTASCKVVVVIPVTGVTLNKKNIVLMKDDVIQLKATISPSNATNKNVTWKSSNTNVVKVDSYGNVTAVGDGIANITVKTKDGSKIGTCKVTVNSSIPVSDLVLEKSDLELKEGESELLKVNVYPSNATDKELKWESTDQNVATVDKNGKIFAKSKGISYIKVSTKDGSIVDRCYVEVTKPVVSVSINKKSLTLELNEYEYLEASINPVDASNKDVIWSSSNEDVVQVSEYGLVRAISVGNAVITAKTMDGGKIDTCNVNVLIPVSEIELNKKSIYLKEGESELLEANVYPSNATNKEIIWSSNNEKIATVDENGEITGRSEGKTVISVITKDGEKIDTCEVEVLPSKATYVSGIIRENTVWSKENSPYILEGNVQIANGATLEIEPGTDIRGYGRELILYGELISIGSKGEKIKFYDLKLSGQNTSYKPFTINLDYVIMNKGYLLPATGNSQSGYINIKNSEFYNLEEYTYIWYPEEEVHITGNIFSSCKGISIGSDYNSYITNNVFYDIKSEYNDYVIESWANYNGSKTYVENNTFYNEGIVLRNDLGGNIVGTNNYWNTNDESQIRKRIYDNTVDLSVENTIDFNPFLSSPHKDTPNFTVY